MCTVFALRSARPLAVEAASAPKRRPSTWGAAAADASSKGAGDANAAGASDLGARIAVDASQRRWYQAQLCVSLSLCIWTIKGPLSGVCFQEEKLNILFVSTTLF